MPGDDRDPGLVAELCEVQGVGLGVLWALVTGAWYVVFTWVVERGRTRVARPAVHRRLQLVTGCALLCIGAVVATGF